MADSNEPPLRSKYECSPLHLMKNSAVLWYSTLRFKSFNNGS